MRKIVFEFTQLIDADIAIVDLNKMIEFSISIQPVCLPQQSSADVNGYGKVVGLLGEYSGNSFDAIENFQER